MSRAYGPPICVRCDKRITGEAETVSAFSASGVRPDSYRHKPGDPECTPPRPPASRLPQYI